MIQLLITIVLWLTLSQTNIQPAPKIENEVLVPFMEALQSESGSQKPPEVIPPFPDLFNDETPRFRSNGAG